MMSPAPETSGAPPAARPGSAGPELYRLLVDQVRDYAIFALDRDGHILTWNAGAQRLKGYPAEEILGRHFSVFYPAEDLTWDKPGHELGVASREGRFEDEGWRLRRDGSRFWANVVITVLRGPEGEVVGFAKVTRDLTGRREAELRAVEDARRLAEEETARRLAEERAGELAALLEQVRSQAVELELRRAEADAANRAKGEFLAAMSHELRTPLNAIDGYAELLELGIHGPVTGAQAEALGRIRRSQRHLLGIIEDLLDFSRAEAGRLTYRIAPFAVAGVVDAVLTMAAPQAEVRGVHVPRPELAPGATALGDPAKTEQVLLNLVSNAVKFTPRGGSARVSCGVEGDRVVLRVRDTGSGIPAEKREEIFEPFVQLGRSLTHTVDGTGLGLAISRELARGMGGDVRVEDSATGAGSTFVLELPRG
ncbi:MAG TPA: ATP-binding protein [Longimicrobiaceae bacterium]|nr:ATP-binding protein [Longimicrobiaceae bacterium]